MEKMGFLEKLFKIEDKPLWKCGHEHPKLAHGENCHLSDEGIKLLHSIEGVLDCAADGVNMHYITPSLNVYFENGNKYVFDEMPHWGPFMTALKQGKIKNEKDVIKYASRGWTKDSKKMFEINTTYGTNFNEKKIMKVELYRD